MGQIFDIDKVVNKKDLTSFSSLDWKHGTISIEGGRFVDKDSFSLGNFAYIASGHEKRVVHEVGHTLNVAAFGSAFHLLPR